MDSDALSAVKAAGVEADMNEPGVPSSQRSREFAIPSVPVARDHPDEWEARAVWSMGTPLAPSLCVHGILCGKVYFSSVFFTFFHKKLKQGGGFFSSLHGGNCFSIVSYHLKENS